MKIDVYSNMHNEEALLPYWLRHYETFADRIFIWEAGSTDSTREILKRHPKVILLPREKLGIDDHYFVNTLYPQYEKYSKGIADWVIIADGDEFVYHPHIREILTNPDVQRRKIILCAGYSMISDKPPTTNGQIYEEIYMGLPDKKESKWTIHAADIHIRYNVGRHGPPKNFHEFRGARNTGIKLLHYRFLGPDYIENRNRKNLERSQVAFPSVPHPPFDRNRLRRCPDGEVTNTYEWLDAHRGEEFNVLKA